MQFSRSCRLALVLSSTGSSITTAATRHGLVASTTRSTSTTATAFLHRQRRPTTTTTVPASVQNAPAPTRRRSVSRPERPFSSTPLAMSTTTTTTTTDKTPNRIALLQFAVTSCKSTNHSTARSNLRSAASKGASLVVLPEIWNGPYATAAFAEYAEPIPSVGYTLDDLAESKRDDQENLRCGESVALMMEEAKSHRIFIVGGSVPESTPSGDIYNTCVCVDPNGTIVAKHRKVHLFDVDVEGGIRFKESDTLSPGAEATWFDAGGELGVVGVGICYDLRFPEYSLLLAQTHRPNLLIFPGAFNLTTGPAHWELLQRARAVDNQCFVLTASPARTPPPEKEGRYPHYAAWGHSTAVSPWGEIVGTCGEEEAVVVCDLDMGRVGEMRRGIPVMEQKRGDLYRLVGDCGGGGVGSGGGSDGESATKRSREEK